MIWPTLFIKYRQIVKNKIYNSLKNIFEINIKCTVKELYNNIMNIYE